MAISLLLAAIESSNWERERKNWTISRIDTERGSVEPISAYPTLDTRIRGIPSISHYCYLSCKILLILLMYFVPSEMAIPAQ
jgi:hypothetical protein